MTQKEFEDLTGMKVNANEFDRVHDIYMACGDDVNKDEFCKRYKSVLGRLELLHMVTEEKKITEQSLDLMTRKLKEVQHGVAEEAQQIVEFLLGKACAYKDTDFYREAVKLVGQREVTRLKLLMDLPLWDEDKAYLKELLEDDIQGRKIAG